MQLTPLVEFYRPLINQPEMADIQFVVGKQGKQVWAHKLVCSVSSTLFKTMFYSQVSWSENINLTDCKTGERMLPQIEIPDIEYDVFMVILGYMYTREAKITKDLVWSVFHSAEKFNLPELQALCLRFVLANLSVNNCLTSLDKCRCIILSKLKNLRRMKSNKLEKSHKKKCCQIKQTQSQQQQSQQQQQQQQQPIITDIETNDNKSEKADEIHENKNKNKKIEEENLEDHSLFCTLNPKNCKCQCCRSTLIQKILRFVKENSNEILSQRHCLDNLHASTCNILLNTKRLVPTEIHVFRRVVERGTTLCKVRNLECCPENLRDTIGDLLNSIGIHLLADDHLQEIWETKLFGLKKLFPALVKRSKTMYRLNYPYLNHKSFAHAKGCKNKEDLKILLLSADEERSWRDDVNNSIKDCGILHVDVLKVHKKTPCYDSMKSYDVIVVYSWTKFGSRQKVGDMLARFVEDGGGLVISTYYSLVEDNQAVLDGRIVDEDFLPIKANPEIRNRRSELGQTVLPNHPVMKGVKKFNGGKKSLRICSMTAEKNSLIISKWSDGTILAAAKQRGNTSGRVVVLNFCFVSDNVYSDGDFWQTNTDGAKLIGNSVLYVGKATPVN
ncbi:btb/poz domain-containing [Anaeramoeba flamelloides]|uniref:Btb/poz domain-containing n=1 Tax=Anaeramoeba flamelloides TaxID=1746091 RepID=A0AAV7YXN4_9EUKA|nr:btb/poz domain-containing [Anaeramoeba flamelloides]